VVSGEWEAEVTGKTCPHCGSQMAQDAKFCGKCGTKL